MTDGNLRLGVFEHEAFFELLEGRRPAARRPDTLRGFSKLNEDAPRGVSRPARGRQDIEKLLRVAAHSPEVVVKVTGRNQAIPNLRAHLAYLGRDEGCHAELDDGQRLIGRDGLVATTDLFDAARHGLREGVGSIAVHVMFSMPPDTVTGEEMLAATRATAARLFANHQYLLVLHEDRPHKHVHVVVSGANLEGRQLRHYKPQVQRWREVFAEEFRMLNIAAEATPRQVRGVVKKSVSRPIQAMRDAERGQRFAQRSRVDQAKLAEAVSVIAGDPDKAERDAPWDKTIRARRAIVEEGWQALARDLEQLGEGGRRGSSLVRRFLANLPPVAYERDEIRQAVLAETRDRNSEREPNSTRLPALRSRKF